MRSKENSMQKTTKQIIEAAARGDGIPPERIPAAIALLEGRGLTATQGKVVRQHMTVAEAADYMRCSRTSLFRSEKDGLLKSVRFRGRKLYRVEDLKASLVAGEVKA
jgi:excisionase family DNA binding protein